MPRIVRKADVVWEGNVARGTGRSSAASSGRSRCRSASPPGSAPGGEDEPGGVARGRPRRLLRDVARWRAGKAGTPPEHLDVRCTVTMDEVGGKGHQIVHSEIEASGTVPNCDEAGIRPGSRSRRCGMPVLGADRASATVAVSVKFARVSKYRRRNAMATDRTMSTTWRGTLTEGRARSPKREAARSARSTSAGPPGRRRRTARRAPRS